MPRRRKPARRGAESGVARAAIYCRVSTEDQAGNDRVSLTEQEADCRQYCERRGYQVVDVFTDAGYSGATAERPDFQRILAAVRARAVDVVVVWKLDRLARAYGPLEDLRNAFRPSDANVEGSREHIDSHTIDLFIWVAKEERSRIVERMLMGRRGAARNGKVQGNKLRWGYRRGEDGRPEIDPSAADEVLRCARAYAAGVPIRDIAADLEARGVLTPQRGHTRWWKSTLFQIITDPAYLGQFEHMGVTVKAPPLYAPELWDAIQAERRRRNVRNPRHTKGQYLLQHKVFCRACGSMFYTETSSTYMKRQADGTWKRFDKKRPVAHYRDGARGSKNRPRGDEDCQVRGPKGGRRTLTAFQLEVPVWEALCDALRHPDRILAGIRARLDALAAEGDDDECRGAEQALSDLKLQRAAAIGLHVRGKITEDDLDTQLRPIQEREEYWRQRLAALKRNAAAAVRRRVALELAAARLDELHSQVAHRLEELSEPERFAERRALVDALIERVWVEPNGSYTIEGILDERPQSAATLAACNCDSDACAKTWV